MAAVVGRQVDAVCLVVGGDDDATTIEAAIFAQVFLIDPQHVRRGGGVTLHVIVERKSVGVAEVARLVDAQNDGFEEAIEVSEHVLRRYLVEVPRTDSIFDWFEQGILTDALLSPKNERVIDLLLRTLHSVGEITHDVRGFLAKNLMGVFEPGGGFAGISVFDGWWPVEIETGHV